ncbi:MAG: type I phosphomannose isomerase catalytic subunit [Pirellulaceae bacterium]
MPSTQSSLYPLLFEPLFRDYLWGGQRLHTNLGKRTGSGVWAESWEIVDHQANQSVVANGPFQGRKLQELMGEFQGRLVGQRIWEKINAPAVPARLRGRFPLLIKFLDAAKDLSVQVHPDDGQAARLAPPDLGKTEAWYVIGCEPGSKIYAGLTAGTNREKFQNAIACGETEKLLNSFRPKVGDCVFIPAGTQHAIGAGLLILEVQQASDTTFRVYDWNRVDAMGKPRDLHIHQALDVTNFSQGPIFPQPTKMDADGGRHLVSCSYFSITEHSGERNMKLGQDDRFEIVVVIDGTPEIGDLNLRVGQTVLLPPLVGGYDSKLHKRDKILQIWIP